MTEPDMDTYGNPIPPLQRRTVFYFHGELTMGNLDESQYVGCTFSLDGLVTQTLQDGLTALSYGKTPIATARLAAVADGTLVRGKTVVYRGLSRTELGVLASFEEPKTPQPPLQAPNSRMPLPSKDTEMLLKAAEIAVSSTHPSAAGYTFEPSHLIDGNIETSWQPESRDAWVTVRFSNDVSVQAVSIANGFQTVDRFGDEFLLNSRIASGRIRFSDDTEVPIRFKPEDRGFARFELGNKLTQSITIFVDQVHEGTRWKDVAISEILVHQIGR
jgi:hypothetical protein